MSAQIAIYHIGSICCNKYDIGQPYGNKYDIWKSYCRSYCQALYWLIYIVTHCHLHCLDIMRSLADEIKAVTEAFYKSATDQSTGDEEAVKRESILGRWHQVKIAVANASLQSNHVIMYRVVSRTLPLRLPFVSIQPCYPLSLEGEPL